MDVYLTIGLIILGGIVMFLSIRETERLLTLVRDNRYHQAWKILLGLEIFFLLGYGGVTILLILQIRSFILLLTGMIFFFGALFVFLVVRTGVLTLQDLLSTQLQQLELQKSKETAEAIAQAKSEFLALMSHEIRTPLNAVLGMSQLLLHTSLEARQQEFVEIIQTSGNALLAILNDILDFSKLDVGNLKLEQHTFNLRDCVEEVVNLATQSARKKNLDLSYHIDPNVPRLIQSDRTRCRQVLLHLVNNAVKFTDQGQIAIQVEKETDQSLLFQIQDTGIGIPADRLDQLFKPFFQVDSSITRKYGGTGLGLAICQKLVALMGGKIWVDSTIGQGTTFFFTIQIALENHLSFPHPALAIAELIDLTLAQQFPARILVAEDNIVNQKLIRLLFEKLGYQIDLVSNGLEVLEQVKTGAYDLIFMDLQMPAMDGLAATRHLRQQTQSHSGQPVIIAITANTFPEDHQACLQAGMNDFISKPLNLEQLQKTIVKWRLETPAQVSD